MSETKVRVMREQLIAAIRERKVEATEAFVKQMEAYQADVEAWKEKYLATLRDVEQQVWNGEEPNRSYPYRPREPRLDVSLYDRHIKMLEISADEYIVVTATDFGAYLR